MAHTKQLTPIPFSRFATVASAGLVAFLALMQGVLTVGGYRPCGTTAIQGNDTVKLAMFELGLAAIGYLVFLLGARRLRSGWEIGALSYNLAIFTLLIGQGLLAYVFIRMSVCAS